MANKGTSTPKLRGCNRAPANRATAPIAVKFGGCGINRVNIPTKINTKGRANRKLRNEGCVWVDEDMVQK